MIGPKGPSGDIPKHETFRHVRSSNDDRVQNALKSNDPIKSLGDLATQLNENLKALQDSKKGFGAIVLWFKGEYKATNLQIKHLKNEITKVQNATQRFNLGGAVPKASTTSISLQDFQSDETTDPTSLQDSHSEETTDPTSKPENQTQTNAWLQRAANRPPAPSPPHKNALDPQFHNLLNTLAKEGRYEKAGQIVRQSTTLTPRHLALMDAAIGLKDATSQTTFRKEVAAKLGEEWQPDPLDENDQKLLVDLRIDTLSEDDCKFFAQTFLDLAQYKEIDSFINSAKEKPTHLALMNRMVDVKDLDVQKFFQKKLNEKGIDPTTWQNIKVTDEQLKVLHPKIKPFI